jgi:tetratricopeptide (TPR) repeat protein
MQKNKSVFQSTKCLSQDEIRLYLNEALDQSTRYRVENHLLDCPLCSDAMEGFAQEYNFDQDEQLDDLKKAIKDKNAESPRISKVNFWTINRIAAVILLLVISLAGFFYWNAQSSEKDLLAQFQSSNDILESVRGAEDFPIGNQFNEGLEFYKNENYQESLYFFDNLLESQPENSIAHYFSGLSALNLGEFDKAIEHLIYTRFNDEKYYEGATWNLILANLGLGNTEEAKALITDLLKIEGGYYNGKAEKLLKEIQ